MTSFIVIALFTTGILAGRFFRKNETAKRYIDHLVTWAVYLLLFLLGISVGINEKVLNDFSKIGYTALLLTIGAVIGSIILAKIVFIRFFKNTNLTDDKMKSD
jgi:uncharacterized membrane protein YbjE (DUF340 family)